MGFHMTQSRVLNAMPCYSLMALLASTLWHHSLGGSGLGSNAVFWKHIRIHDWSRWGCVGLYDNLRCNVCHVLPSQFCLHEIKLILHEFTKELCMFHPGGVGILNS